MTTPWRKVVRDFWQERTRTALVVLAMAIGIAGFSAVLSTYAILTRELDRGYLATNPASAILMTDALDDALLAGVATRPGVGEAEARQSVTGRIKVGPAAWRSLMLFVVRDFARIRVSTLSFEEGAWPPAAGEVLLERDAFQVARARIGDTVTVKTAQGTERALRVSGRVHDVGQAQARMENIVYGYITVETLAALGEQPYLDRLLIQVSGDRFDEAHIRSVASDVAAWLEGQGHAVRRVDVPRPGKHPHTDIMGLLLLVMSSFGGFVLLLSGVLVVNLLTALMASQVRQIGMMKAVGATRAQIARIYFSQALLLGVAAIVVAAPAGVFGGRLLCRSMAVLLNFDITSFSVPAWVYLLVAAVGVVVPLAAAAYPVWKGSGVSVREALADAGVARTAYGAGVVDRALLSVGGLARPVLLAIRNSFRRRSRVALTLGTLAVGGLFFMSALNVRASMIHTLDRLFESRKFDLTVGLGTLSPYDKVERALRDVPGVVRAEGSIVTSGVLPGPGATPVAGANGGHAAPQALGNMAALHGGGAAAGDRFTVIALPADTALLAPNLVEGRGLQPGDTNAIVLNNALAAARPQMRVGSDVVLGVGPSQLTWRIVGIAREPFSPATAYVPRGYIEQLGGHGGQANSLRLALSDTDPGSIDRVRASLDRHLEQEGLRALSSTTTADSRFSFDQHMLMIYVSLIVMSAILASVGGLGLMTTMSLNVLERRREMGILRAIGASSGVVWLIVVAEGAVIGGLSWVLAAVVAWPVTRILGNVLTTAVFQNGLDVVIEPLGVVTWLGVSVALAVLASLVPAWHASRCPVREAIGYE